MTLKIITEQELQRIDAGIKQALRLLDDHNIIGTPLLDDSNATLRAVMEREGPKEVAWLKKNGFRFIGEVEPIDYESAVSLYVLPEEPK